MLTDSSILKPVDSFLFMEIRQYHPIPRLAEMQNNLLAISRYAESGRHSIELKANTSVTPFGILPLAVYAENRGINITYGRNTTDRKRYLRTINFPEGTSNLSRLKQSTYLPLSKPDISEKDLYLARYEENILRNIKSPEIRSSFQNSLKYLTSEMVTNIREHARVQRYWIMAQYWRKTDTCEIAIADSGIGYLQSYVGTEYEVDLHEEAIKNAILGYSSKGDDERGTGIPGLINIFCEGYGGCVAIMSGDRLLYMKNKVKDFYGLDINWQGVFIGIHFKMSKINTLAYLAGY